MLKKKSLYLAALALMLLWTAQNLIAQERINFRRGINSVLVRGKIGTQDYLEYLINGRAGQR